MRVRRVHVLRLHVLHVHVLRMHVLRVHVLRVHVLCCTRLLAAGSSLDLNEPVHEKK